MGDCWRPFLVKNTLSNRVPRALVLQLMAQQPTNERIEHLRDQARRARRLAATLSGDADRHRLISHAEELEETAAQLERQAHGKPRGKS